MEPNTGIYEDENAAMAGLVLRLVEGLAPRSVFLFGSRARGDHRPDSDFDFLVVTKVEDGENGRDYGWVRRPLRGSGVGCDVVPVRCDDLEAELRSNASVIPSVMLDAIKLYDIDEGFLLSAVPPAAAAMCVDSLRGTRTLNDTLDRNVGASDAAGIRTGTRPNALRPAFAAVRGT